MSVLPISEAIPIPEVGYWGWGGSNQSTSNYPNARNLGPGMAEPDLQADLYVADVAADIGPLEARVAVLEGQTVIIEGDIIDINTEISDIEADIVALQAAIVPVTFAPIGSVPSAEGASVTSNQITLQPASAIFGGVISNTTQTFSGDKTIIGNVNAANLSGSNTGDVTLAGVGAIPNTSGASLVGQVLNLQPANSTNPGVITATGQTIGGTKTFVASVTAAGLTTTTGITLPVTSSLSSGTIQQPSGTRLLHTAGTNNTFLGLRSGNISTTSINNTGVGENSLSIITTGNSNVSIGTKTMETAQTAFNNVAVGSTSLQNITSGNRNVAIGGYTLNSCNGGDNIAIGYGSGGNVASGSNTINIGNIGTVNSNEINIGNGLHYKTSIYGIAGVTPPAPTEMVVIDPTTHQLGSVGFIDATLNTTPLLDIGTINSSTVRGVAGSSIPISISKRGRVVTMVIPAFLILSQSSVGSALLFTGITPLPVTYRPVFAMAIPCDVSNSGGFESAIIYISSSGIVQFQLSSGAVFVLPTGMTYDFPITWNAAT